MKTKQTTIEWLLNEWPILKSELPHWLIEQAKEMEMEQIKGSWNHGFDWGMMEQSLAEQGAESTLIDAEHYYNETYGNEQQ
jgi:hypothetical protein